MMGRLLTGARKSQSAGFRIAADLAGNLRARYPDLPVGEPVEVAESDLKRTATEKARRYLLSELVSTRGRSGEAPVAHDRAEVLLREGS